MDAGTTRNRRVVPWEYIPRDHYTSQGRPKRSLTEAQARAHCHAYNAALTGHEYRTSRLEPYHCSVCDQYHTGHLRGR